MNKNYNGDEFKSYISSLKQEGSNIDNWTLKEIYDVVYINEDCFRVPELATGVSKGIIKGYF